MSKGAGGVVGMPETLEQLVERLNVYAELVDNEGWAMTMWEFVDAVLKDEYRSILEENANEQV